MRLVKYVKVIIIILNSINFQLCDVYLSQPTKISITTGILDTNIIGSQISEETDGNDTVFRYHSEFI